MGTFPSPDRKRTDPPTDCAVTSQGPLHPRPEYMCIYIYIYICTWQISKAHVSWEQPIDRRTLVRVGGTHLLPFSGSVRLGNLAFFLSLNLRGQIMIEVVGGLLFSLSRDHPRVLVLVKVQTDGARYG